VKRRRDPRSDLAEQLGNQRDHSGIDAGYLFVGFLAFVVPEQDAARSAGNVGHVRAPLIED
jgi:hypothetical protein